MTAPKPKQVYDNPDAYWNFVTVTTDVDFEGQHFDRKEAGRLSRFGARIHYGASSSPSADVSAEPSGGRHAEPRHPVEHVAADFCLSPLIGQSPGVKASSDNGLITIHSGFH